MPTPESAEAFSRLVTARNRLSEITKQLNEIHAAPSQSKADVERYRQLQAEWDQAYREFEAASQAFTAGLKPFKEMMDEHQIALSEGPPLVQ
jgi:hypothetical protein